MYRECESRIKNGDASDAEDAAGLFTTRCFSPASAVPPIVTKAFLLSAALTDIFLERSINRPSVGRNDDGRNMGVTPMDESATWGGRHAGRSTLRRDHYSTVTVASSFCSYLARSPQRRRQWGHRRPRVPTIALPAHLPFYLVWRHHRGKIQRLMAAMPDEEGSERDS